MFLVLHKLSITPQDVHSHSTFEHLRKLVPTLHIQSGDHSVETVHESCCRSLSCLWWKSRAGSLLASARIPKRYEHCELSNFEFEGPHAHLARARMAACRFVEEY